MKSDRKLQLGGTSLELEKLRKVIEKAQVIVNRFEKAQATCSASLGKPKLLVQCVCVCVCVI